MGFRTDGADDLDRIAAALKQAADGDLQKAVSGAIREIARPLGSEVLEEAVDEFPHGGGFAAYLASKGKVLVSNSLRGRIASVEVIFRNKGVQFAALEKGRFRHPVWARSSETRRQWTWVDQNVHPGAFSRAFEKRAERAREVALEAAQGVLDDIARKA